MDVVKLFNEARKIKHSGISAESIKLHSEDKEYIYFTFYYGFDYEEIVRISKKDKAYCTDNILTIGNIKIEVYL